MGIEFMNCSSIGSTIKKKQSKSSSSSPSTYDAMKYVGLLLSLPVACGLLCLDNIGDTGLLYDTKKKKKQQNQHNHNQNKNHQDIVILSDCASTDSEGIVDADVGDGDGDGDGDGNSVCRSPLHTLDDLPINKIIAP